MSRELSEYVPEMMQQTAKLDLKDFSHDQLVAWLDNHAIEPYRAGQILRWIYRRQQDSFEMMTDLSRTSRDLLARHFSVERLQVVRKETSVDGSQKYLFRLSDGNHIETVLIPEKDHYTLCISSQVGCAQGCAFCHTARGGFIRNLTGAEILAQVRDIQNDLPDAIPLTNIVFMGMGEPLANYRNLLHAVTVITDGSAGFGFSNRRVTISTAGLVPKIAALGRDAKVNLAVSLNATDNRFRDMLMPINRTYPIEDLLSACRDYPLPAGRRITFEYILIAGINDSVGDARRLARLLRPIRSKINLIPFNEHAGCHFKRPAESIILQFQQVLFDENYTAIIRTSKGQDISAACGQLRARAEGIEN
jgi:23S rRNA (adenine2503-C2)-methyltransferase